MHHASCATCRCHANHNGIAQTDTWHIHEKSLAKASPNGSKFETRRRRRQTTRDDDRRRQTTRDDDRRRETTRRRKPCKHSSNPHTPNYKREPFATHSGKRDVLNLVVHASDEMFSYDYMTHIISLVPIGRVQKSRVTRPQLCRRATAAAPLGAAAVGRR